MNLQEKEMVTDFIALYQNLNKSDLLTFTGMIFDYIQNGFINSEGTANAHEVSEEGLIFSSCEFGLCNFTDISFELVYEANRLNGGSFPKHEFYDGLDCWVNRTEAIDIMEDKFIKLSFKEKLNAIMEIFIYIGMGEIDFDFDTYGIEGYDLADAILSYIQDIFPSDIDAEELPF